MPDLRNTRCAIYAVLKKGDLPREAERLLRSCLPEGYAPVAFGGPVEYEEDDPCQHDFKVILDGPENTPTSAVCARCWRQWKVGEEIERFYVESWTTGLGPGGTW